MSAKSCSACNDLREYAPDFVVNGTTDEVGEHLKNDDGLSAADGHTDCEDLMDVNDCLVGNMLDELDSYDVCEWKDFMAAFIGNMYETLKAMIFSTCGQWCAISTMFNGVQFDIGESTTDDSYLVAGKGVSFLIPNPSMEQAGDINLHYVAGGIGQITGTYDFHGSDFTDAGTCANFDNGSTMVTSQNRKGNSFWGTCQGTEFPLGGELISEIRIKKSAYPFLKAVYVGIGLEAGAGSFHAKAFPFTAGSYAWGQHGRCNADGTPNRSGYDSGHLVPDGWLYIQVRLTAAEFFGNTTLSPVILMPMQISPDEIEC